MGQNLDAMVIDRFGRQAFLKPVLVPRGFLPTTYDGSEAAVRSQDGKRWQPVARGYLRQSVLCEALAQHALLRGEGGAPPRAKVLVGPVRWPVIVRVGKLRLIRNRRRPR